jgi:hypothetical protein
MVYRSERRCFETKGREFASVLTEGNPFMRKHGDRITLISGLAATAVLRGSAGVVPAPRKPKRVLIRTLVSISKTTMLLRWGSAWAHA